MKKLIILFSISIFIYGCSTSNDSNGNSTTTVVPIAPSNLTAIVVSTTQVNLSWTDNSTNEIGFKIERKTVGGTYNIINQTNTNVTNFSDQNVLPNTTYTYRVFAYNSVGESLTYTNEITVFTAVVPLLTTTVISNITSLSALSGGNITNDSGSLVTSRGVCWGTSPNPTVSLSTKTIDGSGIGNFVSNLSSLDASTTYYVRAYATNANGIGYGNELTFTTNNIDLTTGLLAYYPFNGNANDASGNGNNGVVTGALLTSDRYGNSNSAYKFDYTHWSWGSGGDEIFIPYNSSFNSQNLSVSVWVYRTSAGYSNQNLTIINRFQFGYNNPNGQTWQVLTQPSSNFIIQTQVIKASNINNQQSLVNTGTNLNLNNWVHIVLTFDGTSCKQYINGVLSDTQPANGLTLNTAGNSGISIGVSDQANGHWGPFDGKIDDIRVYNRALSQSEITYLANN